MKAVIFCRVSTKEQGEEGHSLEAQLNATRNIVIKKVLKLFAIPLLSLKVQVNPKDQSLRRCLNLYQSKKPKLPWFVMQ